MYAIPRHAKGATQPGQKVAITNPDLIAQWWAGESEGEVDEKVLKLLADFKQRELWIACPCRVEGETKAPPLFSIAKTPAGSLTLRRLTDRAEHTKDCIFKFDKREPKAPRPQVELPGLPEPTTPPDFIEDERPTRLPSPPGTEPAVVVQPGVNGHERIDPLARQLHWLLLRGETQYWPLRGKTSPTMVLQAGADVPAQQGLELRSLLYCNPNAWTGAWMDKSFAACEAGGKRPQAILICPVYSASREHGWVTLEPDGHQEKVLGRMAVYGDADSPARYPMLMYAKITADTDGVNLEKAYLHPVLNERHWMLVDSHYEREAMAAIISACEVLERKGIECEVHKPIHDWGQTRARPDFVVIGKNRGRQNTVVVETMGTDDPEYVARKRGTIGKLAPFTVFEDKRYVADGSVDDRLIRFLIGNMTANLL